MDQEIIPADRRLRLVLSVVVVVAMLAAAAFYWQFSRELQDLARTDVQAAIARVAQVRWLTLGSVVVAVLASISLAVSAVRAVRADRFPPPCTCFS
jgi:small-conductance mechanosensitive channel